jgi:hypothetical protein
MSQPAFSGLYECSRTRRSRLHVAPLNAARTAQRANSAPSLPGGAALVRGDLRIWQDPVVYSISDNSPYIQLEKCPDSGQDNEPWPVGPAMERWRVQISKIGDRLASWETPSGLP